MGVMDPMALFRRQEVLQQALLSHLISSLIVITIFSSLLKFTIQEYAAVGLSLILQRIPGKVNVHKSSSSDKHQQILALSSRAQSVVAEVLHSTLQ